MLKNITDVMNNINTSELDTFISKTDATFQCVSDIKETKIDYSWLDVLEDTLPSIDKIVRNPRRFIVQEEDVLIVEKTKRVSLETIKHLAVHSQNIQDINENGDVVPKKLLNVYKEDSSDLYENRFIYTLVSRLESFINRQLEVLEIVSNKEITKEVIYNARTELNDRKINVELKMHEIDYINLNEDGEDIKNRILACYEVISDFKSTQMIRELIGCTPVMNPIRKTNLILREPNFQKAYILWQYLDNFELRDPKTIHYERITDVSKETKDEFTLSYFIDCNAIDEKRENLMKYKDIESKLKKLLDEYVYEEKQDIEILVNKAKDFYIDSLEEKKNRENEINNIYDSFFNKYTNKVIEINKIFK